MGWCYGGDKVSLDPSFGVEGLLERGPCLIRIGIAGGRGIVGVGGVLCPCFKLWRVAEVTCSLGLGSGRAPCCGAGAFLSCLLAGIGYWSYRTLSL